MAEMTIEQAIKIIHPATSGNELTEIEYYYGFNGKTMAIAMLNEASLIACEAMGKQIPYKPEPEDKWYGVGKCKCGVVFLDKSTKYCGNCGQKLNWEAENESK